MKYAGLPMAMWAAFHGSFTQHLTMEFGLTQQQAKAVEQLAKQKYRELIEKIPEFEKGDRFKMNIVNCAMLAAGASSSGSTRWHPAGRTATADTIKNKSRPKAAEKCFVQVARDGVLDHDGHEFRCDGHDLLVQDLPAVWPRGQRALPAAPGRWQAPALLFRG